MRSRDYKDIISGSAIFLFGLYTLIYALYRLDIGTLTQMGPGMFPAGAGALMVLFGLVIVIPAWGRPAELPSIDWRSAGIILLAMLLFGVCLPTLGIVPAIILLTSVSLLASSGPKNRLLTTALLSLFICVFIVLVFQIGLGLRIQLFWWSS